MKQIFLKFPLNSSAEKVTLHLRGWVLKGQEESTNLCQAVAFTKKTTRT